MSVVFKIGQKVKAKGMVGVVRFFGKTQFATGDWVGVELEEDSGKNDGSVRGVRYFECAENHGLFLKASQVVSRNDSSLSSPPRRVTRSAVKNTSPSGIKRPSTRGGNRTSPSGIKKPSTTSPVRRSRIKPPSSKDSAHAPTSSSKATPSVAARGIVKRTDGGSAVRRSSRIKTPATSTTTTNRKTSSLRKTRATKATSENSTRKATQVSTRSSRSTPKRPVSARSADSSTEEEIDDVATIGTMSSSSELKRLPVHVSSSGAEGENVEELRLEIEALRVKLKCVESELSDAREGAEQDSKIANGEIDVEKQRAADLDAQLDDEKKHAVDLAAQLDDEKKRAADLDAQLDDEKKHAVDLDAQLDDEKKRATDLAAQLDDEKKHAADLDAQLDEERKRAADLDSKLSTTKSELEKAKQRCSELGTKQDTLVKTAAKGHASASKSQRAVEELTKKLEEKEEILELCTLEKEEIEVEMESLKDQLSDTTLEMDQIKRELADAREELAASSTSSSKVSSTGDVDVAEQNNKLRTALAALHAQSTKAKQEAAKKIRELEKSAASVDRLDSSVKRLAEKCEELESENKDLKDAVDDGAAYESMIEELSRSEMEKSDRISELEQSVEELQEMELLAQEESDEMQNTMASLREELESKSSKLYKMIPLVQRLQRELREKVGSGEHVRAILTGVRNERDALRTKVQKMRRQQKDESGLVQSARTKKVTLRALEIERRNLSSQLNQAKVDAKLNKVRSRRLVSLVPSIVARDGVEIVETMHALNHLAANIRSFLASPVAGVGNGSAGEDEDTESSVGTEYKLQAGLDSCAMRSMLLSLRHPVETIVSVVESKETKDDIFVVATSSDTLSAVQEANGIVSTLLDQATRGANLAPDTLRRDFERVGERISNIVSKTTAKADDDTAAGDHLRPAKLRINARFACDEAALSVATLSLSARLGLARSNEVAKTLSDDDVAATAADSEMSKTTKNAISATEASNRLRKCLDTARSIEAIVGSCARSAYVAGDDNVAKSETFVSDVLNSAQDLRKRSEDLLSATEDGGDWSAVLNRLGDFLEEDDDRDKKTLAAEEGARDNLTILSALAALQRACAALRGSMSHVSEKGGEATVASAASPSSIEGFVEPLVHLAYVEATASGDADTTDLEAPWQRYVENVRSRFTAIARLGPDLKESRENLKSTERELANMRRLEQRARMNRDTLETRLKEELAALKASQEKRDALQSSSERFSAKSSQLEVVVNELNGRVEELDAENKSLRDDLANAGTKRKSPLKSRSVAGDAVNAESAAASSEHLEALKMALRSSRRTVAYWRSRESKIATIKSLPRLPRVQKLFESVRGASANSNAAASETKVSTREAAFHRLRKISGDLVRLQSSSRIVRLGATSSATVQFHDQLVAASELKSRLFDIESFVARSSRKQLRGSNFAARSESKIDEAESKASLGPLIGRVKIPASKNAVVIPIRVERGFVVDLHSRLMK
eukprot:g61.t1